MKYRIETIENTQKNGNKFCRYYVQKKDSEDWEYERYVNGTIKEFLSFEAAEDYIKREKIVELSKVIEKKSTYTEID